MPRRLRVALVCGDGLPVSGLLTVFRNVLAIGRELGLVDVKVPAELGFSWRPDKGGFFPAGAGDQHFPPWLSPAPCSIPQRVEPGWLANELTAVRRAVAAYPRLGEDEISRLRERAARLAGYYHEHFARWLADNEVDWVFALNMTLSDAVPATRAFQDAAASYFSLRGSGGIVYWDHDLFGSCAVREPRLDARFYPETPNDLTPVPQRTWFNRWVVVSDALAEEASRYPTELRPQVAPNVLPVVPAGPLEEHHRAFARQWGLDLGRPVILNPVRLFRVKGVHIAVKLLSAMREAAPRHGMPVPSLLVFGTTQEDPEYAREVLALIDELKLRDEVKVLDGVPVGSHLDQHGRWRLDEVDLLRLAAASRGGVAFTPGVTDVETIGLGPALGALAGLPSVVTRYNAFEAVYGREFHVTRVADGAGPEAVSSAADQFLDVLKKLRGADPGLARKLAVNRRLTEERFPSGPWRVVWLELAGPR